MKKKKETGVVFKKTLWVLATLYMLTACTGCARNQTEFVRVPSSGTVQSMTEAGEDPASQESRAVSEIYVHVCGAVKNNAAKILLTIFVILLIAVVIFCVYYFGIKYLLA